MDDRSSALTLESRVAASPTATSVALDGEVVVLDVERNAYFGLDDVGARAWRCLEQEATSVADIRDALARHYDADVSRIERDLLHLLHQLHAHGLLVVNPDDSQAAKTPADARASSEQRLPAGQDEQAIRGAVEELRQLKAEERRRRSGSRWIRPPKDWWMLACAGSLTVLIRGALSFWSLKRVVRALRRVAATLPKTGSPTPAYRRRAAWAANAVGHRLLPNRPCLTQALVLQYLLLRRGDDRAELHIGVAKGESGELLAHAWIERNGRVLIGGTGSPDKYKRLEGVGSKVSAT